MRINASPATAPVVVGSLDRGVYLAPWQGPSGELYAVGVSSAGRRILEAVITNRDHADAVIDMLWTFLDQEDPPGPRPTLLT